MSNLARMPYKFGSEGRRSRRTSADTLQGNRAVFAADAIAADVYELTVVLPDGRERVERNGLSTKSKKQA